SLRTVIDIRLHATTTTDCQLTTSPSRSLYGRLHPEGGFFTIVDAVLLGQDAGDARAAAVPGVFSASIVWGIDKHIVGIYTLTYTVSITARPRRSAPSRWRRHAQRARGERVPNARRGVLRRDSTQQPLSPDTLWRARSRRTGSVPVKAQSPALAGLSVHLLHQPLVHQGSGGGRRHPRGGSGERA